MDAAHEKTATDSAGLKKEPIAEETASLPPRPAGTRPIDAIRLVKLKESLDTARLAKAELAENRVLILESAWHDDIASYEIILPWNRRGAREFESFKRCFRECPALSLEGALDHPESARAKLFLSRLKDSILSRVDNGHTFEIFRDKVRREVEVDGNLALFPAKASPVILMLAAEIQPFVLSGRQDRAGEIVKIDLFVNFRLLEGKHLQRQFRAALKSVVWRALAEEAGGKPG